MVNITKNPWLYASGVCIGIACGLLEGGWRGAVAIVFFTAAMMFERMAIDYDG